MLFTILLLNLTASADVRFEAFSLKADNSFEVQFLAPTPQVARGVLDNAQRIEITGAQVNTTVQAHTRSFVILTFVELGKDLGDVVILEELERLKFGRIHHQRIQGAVATLHQDLDGAFRDLKKRNGWDATLTIRAMVSFFEEKPGRKIKDFYDAVELGHMRTVARPDTRGKLPSRKAPSKNWESQPSREREAPQERVRPREPEVAREREVVPPAEKRPPKRTREVRPREPQPWEPRRLPPPSASSQYPGQRIKPRVFGYSGAERPPRRPKTLLELLFP